MRGRKALFFVSAAVLVLLAAAAPFAQEAPGGRGRGRNTPQTPEEQQKRREEFRQRSTQRLKEQLSVKDDAEWKVIEPRISAVQEAQRSLSGGGFGGRGMRGNRGGGEGRQGGQQQEEPQTEVGKKMAALRTVLQNEKAEASEIKKALAELRESKKKAEQDLAKARTALREVLTQRQEAVLVVMGTLD